MTHATELRPVERRPARLTRASVFTRSRSRSPDEPMEVMALDVLHRVVSDDRRPGRPRRSARCWCGADGQRPRPCAGTVQSRCHCRGGCQHLERDLPAQGSLDRLVDHPHAAAAQLANDAVIAHVPRMVTRPIDRSRGSGSSPGRAPPAAWHDRENRAHQIGKLGISLDVFVEPWVFPIRER